MMDEVRKNSCTQYKTPSSETFKLRRNIVFLITWACCEKKLKLVNVFSQNIGSEAKPQLKKRRADMYDWRRNPKLAIREYGASVECDDWQHNHEVFWEKRVRFSLRHEFYMGYHKVACGPLNAWALSPTCEIHIPKHFRLSPHIQ
jgi:hypothetical protein